jgi:hypothetical protein
LCAEPFRAAQLRLQALARGLYQAKSAACIARAKQAYDSLIAALYRIQADTRTIVTATERQLTDEFYAAQKRISSTIPL